jgi:NAD(P)-dependent dehydrogenase (short-subunit alcohol dehydrogenase family)
MKHLEGKIAIVTGAGQGVGLGIAQALASAGARLVITGRDEAKLRRAAAAIAADPAEVLTVAGDARRRASAEAAVAAAVARFGRVDIVVNNAQSSKPFVPLEQIDDETVALTLESGLLGTLYFMQAAFPHMKERGGSIINLGSREGVFGGVGFGIYAATKEGIRGLSRVAAREWGKYGIRVNVVNPAALTDAAQSFFAAHPEAEQYYRSQIALGRLGEPRRDIGSVAVFLAGDDSAYVTGQTINVDGGQVML